MRLRSAVRIYLPTLVAVLALAATWPTRAVAIAWLTAGVLAIGHRPLDSYPSLGLGPTWREGPRSALVLVYYLIRWPRYVGGPVSLITLQLENALRRTIRRGRDAIFHGR